nr:MAG TPA: hypothetical protein [Caudoviricetes sp.]
MKNNFRKIKNIFCKMLRKRLTSYEIGVIIGA